jgi:hypothetical protein
MRFRRIRATGSVKREGRPEMNGARMNPLFLLTLWKERKTQMASGSQQYSAFELMRTNIDDALDTAYEREKSFRTFLEGLQISGITAGDFDRIIVGAHFPTGSAFLAFQEYLPRETKSAEPEGPAL